MPIFVQPTLGGVGFEAGVGLGGVLAAQLVGILAVALWAVLGSAIVALLLSVMLPLRGSEEEEAAGLDAVQHRQQAWDFR
jgi:Amt family ammonium transporter